METIGAILAGGKSSRMGQDKAHLLVAGETILVRTARRLYTATGETPLVIGRDGDDFVALFLPDDAPDLGPIGGLQTALRYADNRAIVVVSCDMPALTADAIGWLLARERGEYGAVVRNGEQLEPLFAVYTPACAPLIAANIVAGRRSLHAPIHAGGGGFTIHDAPRFVADALTNVNTPQEWDAFVANTAL